MPYVKMCVIVYLSVLSSIFGLLLPCFFLYIGAGAVEFIICHAEVKIAFVEAKKIPEVINHVCLYLHSLRLNWFTRIKFHQNSYALISFVTIE